MASGTIILLNGMVSAGKSNIARAVQHIMAEPYVHLGADILGAMCPPRYAGGTHAAEGVAWTPLPDTDPPQTAMVVGPYGHFLVEGLHRAVAALSHAGHHIVVDHIFLERHWLLDCLAVWRDLPVYMIGVRCPLPVAEQRERDRPDRVKGVARWQFDRVHTDVRYDLEVDTSLSRPKDCALAIERRLRDGPPSAARLLASNLLDTSGQPIAPV
jgi:chloramphenicol 3-O phosphotransferase